MKNEIENIQKSRLLKYLKTRNNEIQAQPT